MTHPDILSIKGARVCFGGLVAVNNASLSVPRGEIHGVIGPNGAGKSTLFNAISGLVPLAAGAMALNGVDVTRMAAHTRASLGMMRTFQSVQLVKSMTVLENILVGLHARPRMSRGTPRCAPPEPGATDIERACRVAEELGLTHCLYTPVDLLSFREQRFVEIGRALVSDPQLVMLDEPAAGLAAPEVDELRDVLQNVQRERALTVLLVEHVISLVMQVCQRVTVLEYGSVIACGTGAQIMADAKVIKAYLGEDIDA